MLNILITVHYFVSLIFIAFILSVCLSVCLSLTDRQTDRQAGRQTDRQTDSLSLSLPHTHTHTHARTHARTHAHTHITTTTTNNNSNKENSHCCRHTVSNECSSMTRGQSAVSSDGKQPIDNQHQHAPRHVQTPGSENRVGRRRPTYRYSCTRSEWDKHHGLRTDF